MSYFTTTILSAKQELTPEGFLLCRDVPIARTGVQLYAPGEVPVEARDGLIRIERLPEQVFDERTIASFEGKPITLDHPGEDVTPDNWSKLAKGVVQNVRRGSGIEDDLLLADFLITDKAAIKRVRDEGLREVSCGYDAGYEQIEPGRGKQTNIVGNHVALVDKGRCGSRCAIGDSLMKTKKKFLDRVRAAFKSRDEAELEEALKDTPTGDEEAETEEQKKEREAKEEKEKTSDALTKMADSLAALVNRVGKLETRDKKSKDEEAEETEEEKKKREAEEEKNKTSDSALAVEVQDVRARVEILSPGMAFITTDAAAGAAKMRDSLCAMRRKALEAAYASPKTRDAVAPLVAGRDLQKLTCDALNSTFIGASEIVRRENNAPTKVTFDSSKVAAGVRSTISDMNRRAAEFWSGK